MTGISFGSVCCEFDPGSVPENIRLIEISANHTGVDIFFLYHALSLLGRGGFLHLFSFSLVHLLGKWTH